MHRYNLDGEVLEGTMAKVAIIGAGYVGLTTGACLAHLGHDVIIADNKDDRVKAYKQAEFLFTNLGLKN